MLRTFHIFSAFFCWYAIASVIHATSDLWYRFCCRPAEFYVSHLTDLLFAQCTAHLVARSPFTITVSASKPIPTAHTA